MVRLHPCRYAVITMSLLATQAAAVHDDLTIPVTDPVIDSAEHPIVSFLKDGTVNFDVRFRYEMAEIDGFGESNAFTLRTRLGYTTKRFEGFQAMVELEDNRAADYNQYNAAGLNGQGGLSAIADPEDTELNRLWIDYDFSVLREDLTASAKLGRQRINLDDQRFVGTVGWRQLEQTFDAIRLSAKPIDDLTATYIYIDEVNRIFGPNAGRDFDSNSHLINIAYTGNETGKLVGFAYLLDLGPSGSAGAGVSSQTYGVKHDGSVQLSDGMALGHMLSFAHQSDYGDNAASYKTIYIATKLKIKFIETAGGFVGGGFEMLGSDDGAIAFSTPLATGHKFNGFADAFLATPAAGLRDYYATGGLTIPGIDVKLVVFYHYFTNDDTSAELGTEFDFVLAKKINANWSMLAKYSYFDGTNGLADIERFWMQIELKY